MDHLKAVKIKMQPLGLENERELRLCNGDAAGARGRE